MLFSGIGNLVLLSLVQLTPEQELIKSIPADWYKSTSNVFDLCVATRFEIPLCPRISKASAEEALQRDEELKKELAEKAAAAAQAQAAQQAPLPATPPAPEFNSEGVAVASTASPSPAANSSQLTNFLPQFVNTPAGHSAAQRQTFQELLGQPTPHAGENSRRGRYNFESEAITTITGPLTPQSLFQASIMYQIKRPPVLWLSGLKLGGRRPSTIEPRLWAEAKWLWAKILFDQRRYTESNVLFDQLVESMKGRALFHQQRAWVQFFTGKFDRSLGSIVSAESPLIYHIPFFDKYFIRGLIERQTCRWGSAFNSIAKGRESLQFSKPKPESHPWVVLCERKQLGSLCENLKAWYSSYYASQVKQALDDLDLLEIELQDRRDARQAKRASAEIIWPQLGENWGDEVGYHSVPVQSKCDTSS